MFNGFGRIRMQFTRHYPWMLIVPLSMHMPLHAKPLPQIDVHFVFATNHEKARAFDNYEQAQKEVEILNRYFITEKKQRIFDFKLKRYISYKEFEKMDCGLLALLEQKSVIKGREIAKAFSSCFPKRPNSVYMFVYDAYSQKKGWDDITSWGLKNNAHPFILVDWERLNYQIQAAVPHEMGHAFGLKHVCEPNAKPKDSTNIMASADCKLGSGGKRNKGFNKEQLNTILDHYEDLKNVDEPQ